MGQLLQTAQQIDHVEMNDLTEWFFFVCLFPCKSNEWNLLLDRNFSARDVYGRINYAAQTWIGHIVQYISHSQTFFFVHHTFFPLPGMCMEMK